MYQCIIAHDHSTDLKDKYNHDNHDLKRLREVLEVTPFAGLTNAPAGTLEEHCTVQGVEVKPSGQVTEARHPVGKDLFGKNDIPAHSTSVYISGDFVLKLEREDNSNIGENINFADPRLEPVIMSIRKDCPGYYINH